MDYKTARVTPYLTTSYVGDDKADSHRARNRGEIPPDNCRWASYSQKLNEKIYRSLSQGQLRTDPRPTQCGIDIIAVKHNRGQIDKFLHDHVKPWEITTREQFHGLAKKIAGDEGKEKLVRVTAEPGLGKSTYFPMLLAHQTRSCVLVLEHSDALASMIAQGAEEVKAKAVQLHTVEVKFALESNLRQILTCASGPTVVYVSTPHLFQTLSRGSLPSTIVLHDEAHFCDYMTYTWKSICMYESWVKCNVQMSATLDAEILSDSASRDKPNGVQRIIHDISVPDVRCMKDSDLVGEAVAPWTSAAMRTTNTLIFSDDYRANVQRANELLDQGIRAYVLDGDTLARDVTKLALEMSSAMAGFVFFVDSTYRDGYTFKVDVVIDTCRIREAYITRSGERKEVYRDCYYAEAMQAAARAGRIQRGMVYRNAVPLRKGLAQLAIGEVGHAYALGRALGYQPDADVTSAFPAGPEMTASQCVNYLRTNGGWQTNYHSNNNNDNTGDSNVHTVPGNVSTFFSDLSIRPGCDTDLRSRDLFVKPVPGTRFDVPPEYRTEDTPYWCARDTAMQTVTRIISGNGPVLMEHLSESELRWFISTFVDMYNHNDELIVTHAVKVKVCCDLLTSGRVLTRLRDDIARARAAATMRIRTNQAIFSVLQRLHNSGGIDLWRTDLDLTLDLERLSHEYRTLIAPATHPQYIGAMKFQAATNSDLSEITSRLTTADMQTWLPVSKTNDDGIKPSSSAWRHLEVGAHTWFAPTGQGDNASRRRSSSSRGTFSDASNE